jgi:hypothetical protein
VIHLESSTPPPRPMQPTPQERFSRHGAIVRLAFRPNCDKTKVFFFEKKKKKKKKKHTLEKKKKKKKKKKKRIIFAAEQASNMTPRQRKSPSQQPH